jgi:hypothetical protein
MGFSCGGFDGKEPGGEGGWGEKHKKLKIMAERGQYERDI